jgi:hypothetical protein
MTLMMSQMSTTVTGTLTIFQGTSVDIVRRWRGAKMKFVLTLLDRIRTSLHTLGLLYGSPTTKRTWQKVLVVIEMSGMMPAVMMSPHCCQKCVIRLLVKRQKPSGVHYSQLVELDLLSSTDVDCVSTVVTR